MQSDITILRTWIKILPFLASGFAALLGGTACKREPDRMVLPAVEYFSGLLREKGKALGFYKKSERQLEKNGASYHFWKKINPGSYLALRLALAVACLLVCSGLKAPELGFAGMAVLFFLPSLLLEYLNKKDNDRMLSDIKMIYHSLSIQIRAGIYITDALSECYRNVKDVRLKDAFLELSGDIVMKSDIFHSLEKLQAKFNNRYIDSLCITILQALESGQAVEILNDIGEQLRDMENALLEKKKGALDRSVTFYQLGLLLAELIIVVYACVIYMFRAAGSF